MSIKLIPLIVHHEGKDWHLWRVPGQAEPLIRCTDCGLFLEVQEGAMRYATARLAELGLIDPAELLILSEQGQTMYYFTERQTFVVTTLLKGGKTAEPAWPFCRTLTLVFEAARREQRSTRPP